MSIIEVYFLLQRIYKKRKSSYFINFSIHFLKLKGWSGSQVLPTEKILVRSVNIVFYVSWCIFTRIQLIFYLPNTSQFKFCLHIFCFHFYVNIPNDRSNLPIPFETYRVRHISNPFQLNNRNTL